MLTILKSNLSEENECFVLLLKENLPK